MTQTVTKRGSEKAQQAPMSTTEELEKQERDLRNQQNSLNETFYLSMMTFWLFVIPGLMASIFFSNFIPVAAGVAISIGLVVWIKKYQS